VLALVGTIRAIAFDRGLTAPDQMRRIRDAINEQSGVFDDPDDES
jgi:hypothetical protein